MGRILILLLLFISLPFHGYPQTPQKEVLKSNYAYLSLAYYHIYGKNIPNAELQEYVVAIDNFGDKQFMRNLIIQSWLAEDYQTEEENTADVLRFNLDPFKLPFNFDYPPDNLFNVFKFFILNEFRNYPVNQQSSYFPIDDIIAKSFLIIPNISSVVFSEDNSKNCTKLYVQFYEVALNNPAEFQLLLDYFNGAHANYISNCSSISAENYYMLIEKNTFNKYPLLPYSLSCLDLKEAMNTNKNPVYLQTKDIKSIFNRLLNREPSEFEMAFYNELLAKNSPEDLKIVYYLIITSEEYNYH